MNVKNSNKMIENLSCWYENYVLLKLLMFPGLACETLLVSIILVRCVLQLYVRYKMLVSRCGTSGVVTSGTRVSRVGGALGPPGPALVLELCQLRTVSLVTVSSVYS